MCRGGSTRFGLERFSSGVKMQLGSGGYVYEVEEAWAKLPDGWDMKLVAGVGVDSRDRVYAFNRGDHPMIVFDSDGSVVTSWGEETLNFAHAVYVDASDNLWLTDRYGQVVWKFDTDGKPAAKRWARLGSPQPAADRSTIRRSLRSLRMAICTFPTDTSIRALTDSRPPVSICTPGANLATRRGSSTCRTACGSIHANAYGWPTAKTRESSFFNLDGLFSV